MKIYTGVIDKILDNDKYIIEANIKGYGIIKSVPLRFENEPLVGDEVLVIILDDVFESASVYIPFRDLTKDDFIGIARRGFKMEFTDSQGIEITSAGVKINIKDQSVTIDAPTFTITGATPTSAVPGLSGNLNCIPNCPILGIPHGINKNIKTG